MKDLFVLDPEIVFLNHGSFGAAPQAVLEAYQKWQYRLERQPVQFIVREMLATLENAREVLGAYINASASNLVFVPNVTFGVNIVARSLQLAQGDEILASDHEYGACQNIWSFVAQKSGAVFIQQPIPLPLDAPETVADQLWRAVTPRTKVILLSHITSPTAQQMPIELICRRARQAGILTVIDGAHAPGQIMVDLVAIDADFYVGNCHKWMLSPKGAGFLYTRPNLQALVEPLVVSWGWGENSPYTTGSAYIDALEWWGTNDPSAYLAVPAAIQFMEDHDWDGVRANCRQILANGIRQIGELTGLDSVYSDKARPFSQMGIAQLPPIKDISNFQDHLYQQYKIEVPCTQWNGENFLRISVQAYNSADDIDTLRRALAEMLPDWQFLDSRE
jgi:isopenicillin-N epimerase